jgi:multiple sugar transport system substrate-binding protein
MKMILSRALAVGLVVALLLAGCDARTLEPLLSNPLLATLLPQATPTAAGGTSAPAAVGMVTATVAPGSLTAPGETQTPGLQATAASAATSTAASGPQELTIWVPPQFDPESGDAGAALFKNRLAEFSVRNPNVKIKVRVKAPSGPGGLMESLSAASAAAPDALPSLVALSRDDLENAALKGLVFPLDGLAPFKDDPDWYSFARDLATIQGSTFGLPFGGDALILMYRPEKISTPPADWTKVLSFGQPVAFPADDPQALVTLALYRSAGGGVEDAQHRPVLQPDALAQVLKLYGDGARQGSFPSWLSQYQTDGQAWQAYKDGRVHMVVDWSSDYLAELPADTSAVPLPPLGSSDYTLATGWVWAVADPTPERHALSAHLAQFLVESDFLAAWTAATGQLPPRPTSLAAWSNQSLKAMLSRVVISAQVRPNNDLTASLGPVLRDACQLVIKNQSDPTQAAEAAVERLGKP